jgi:hypothetical protein
MKPQVITARLISILFLSLAIYGCGGSSNSAPTLLGSVDIPITLSGDFSVSAATPNSAATGSGTLTLNRDTGDLTGSITISSLSSNANNAHVHVGIAGISGGVVVPLDYTNTTVTVPANTMLSSAQMDALLGANYYINVHTANNGLGELRGQIVPAGFQVIRVVLDGASEVPAVITGSSAIGYLTINSSTLSLQGNITSTGITGDTAAHIHGPAAAGVNAGVLVPFPAKANDDALWALPDPTTISQINMDYIIADQTYLNVHTPGNPGGEIRGQIVP